MSEHTPGPWEAAKYLKQDVVFDTRGNGTLAICTVHDIVKELAEKNAQLIAAAPDLLEACKRASESLGMHGPCTNNNCSMCARNWDFIHAAINKATNTEATPATESEQVG